MGRGGVVRGGRRGRENGDGDGVVGKGCWGGGEVSGMGWFAKGLVMI